MIMAPGKEVACCTRVGASSVRIADIGREKFEETALCLTTSIGDQPW